MLSPALIVPDPASFFNWLWFHPASLSLVSLDVTVFPSFPRMWESILLEQILRLIGNDAQPVSTLNESADGFPRGGDCG